MAAQTCQNSMLQNFHLIAENQACETKKRRGLAGADVRLSKMTIKRIKVGNSFVEVQCQFKTHARSFAESDVRNLYPFAIMNAAFISSTVAAMCFNWDATQYCINPEGHATIVKCKVDNDMPATALSDGGLGFAIKYYHFDNANGDLAPAVFIVADDTMGVNDFFFEEVVGLSHTQIVGAFGILYSRRQETAMRHSIAGTRILLLLHLSTHVVGYSIAIPMGTIPLGEIPLG